MAAILIAYNTNNSEKAYHFYAIKEKHCGSDFALLQINSFSLLSDINVVGVNLKKSFSQSELLGQFRLIGDHASDKSGERICLTQNAYAEI